MRRWDTCEPLDPGFEQAWRERLSRAPHANFSLDPVYLSWEAARGRPALAALLDEGGRAGALVLREAKGGWACGWKWRWQAVIEDAGRRGPVGMSGEEARWLFAHARRLAGGRRLRCFFPVPAPAGVASYRAATTLIQSLEHSDDEFLKAMNKGKRRMVQRAQRERYEVFVARSPDQFKAFWLIQRETYARHGIRVPGSADARPGPGELWREWELPWMWLVVGAKNGIIETGSGDGVWPGGMLEGRTAASTPLARKDGAYALVSYEELRLGRDLGHRWLNLGGDTTFKREVAGSMGQRVPMHCWLAGGAAGGLGDRLEAWSHQVRAALRKRGDGGETEEGRY